MTPRKAQASSGKLRQAQAHESARAQPQLHPEKNSTRTRPLQWSSCTLVIFSCSNVINDIILRRTARCPRGAIGSCRLPLPRAPGATTAFHPRAPLTQRDRRFLPFDSTRTNANPPGFGCAAPPPSQNEGVCEPPKSASAAEPPTTPSPGVSSQFFTRFRPTMSKSLRMPSASLSF